MSGPAFSSDGTEDMPVYLDAFDKIYVFELRRLRHSFEWRIIPLNRINKGSSGFPDQNYRYALKCRLSENFVTFCYPEESSKKDNTDRRFSNRGRLDQNPRTSLS